MINLNNFQINVWAALSLLFLPIYGTAIGLLFMGIFRRLSARIHQRYGPPLWQPYADVIKLFSKKSNFSHGWVYDLGVIMGLAGPALMLWFIPFNGLPNMAPYGDLIVILYTMVIGPLGMALAAAVGASPWGVLGVARALGMMFGYELPFMLAVLAVVAKAGTLRLTEIAAMQQSAGLWNPSNWFYALVPVAAVAGHIALQGVMGEKPFDQAIAPHEIGTGIMTEFGGKYLGMMFLFAALNLFAELALFSVLFLGGGPLWLVTLKALFLYVIASLVDITYGRFRPDQAFALLWKWPTVLALIGLMIVLFS
ncbi:NADH-quinone oxidoreductase subunit H [Coprothermobacteraceae bacterium]|nr:NADH-quinone oxidoreductase subunit H [Coprothermobacteraceae bacterium]